MNDDGLGNMTDKKNETQGMMNVETDRLSSLPDDLIHKIISFIDIKRVVQTTVLSSRWRFVWTTTPYLDFSTEGFSTLVKFSKFVKHVLSGRNNEVEVSSVKLSFRGKPIHVSVKRIMNYAFSHNVQEMTIACLGKKVEFPLSLFNSQSLKHLTLRGSRYGGHSMTATSTLELPSLTTLHLENVTLHDDNSNNYMGKCLNLKNLSISCCNMMGSGGFSICHTQLSNLTLKYGDGVVKVSGPQLKNLSLAFHYDPFPFSMDGVPYLEKVDLCIHYPRYAHKVIDLLQQFRAVKFLTLNLEIVEVLSSSVKLISNQPSPFANLKSLKIYPLRVCLDRKPEKKVTISTEVKSYLLDSLESATLTMVSREEIRAVKNLPKHIPQVRVLLDKVKTDLDQWKTLKKSRKAKMHDKGKDKADNQGTQLGTEITPLIGGRMKLIESCWTDLSKQMDDEKEKVSRIFSELGYMERLLTDLPASKRVKMQPCFTSMCGEAYTLMNKTLDLMKIQSDMKRRRLSIHFDGLAKASHPSS